MKKISKRILIVLGMIVGLIILLALGYGYKFYTEIKIMTPAETSSVNDSVFCLKDKFVNAFVFRGKTGYLMVDAGIHEESVKAELKKLGIAPEQITAILLTHTDTDHTGALELFKKAKIYIHKDEEQMINGKNGKFFFVRIHWKFGLYKLLSNNDFLMIDGISVKVMHTPGHTPGSCCFLINGDYLLAGDNVAYLNGKFQHFNNFFNMNTDEQEASLKHIPELNTVKYVLTGHYGIIRRRNNSD